MDSKGDIICPKYTGRSTICQIGTPRDQSTIRDGYEDNESEEGASEVEVSIGPGAGWWWKNN
jgi:hypothetical protein